MQRPISPHLQVYKPQVTSVMSILHRASGVFIAIGLALISLLFIALPYGEAAYSSLASLYASTPVKLLLLLFAMGLFYHLCNGIRHLRWDMVKGLTIQSISSTAWMVWAGVAILTILLLI